ncbi:MAG: NUDIX domain-containing protein [Geminicoccales bacterium]
MEFADSYLGQLRSFVGSRLLLVPGTRVVIENAAGQILLQKRSDFGIWGLPGGSAEEGEDLEAVAIREVQEETGLIVSQLQPFGFACDPALETITYPNGDRCQNFSLNFFTRHFEGVPTPADDESTECTWFSSENLPEMLPNMRQSVVSYLRFVSSGQFQMIRA